jgi:hypothetical protein
MEMIVLRSNDEEAILSFEMKRLDADDSLDVMEKQLKSWHAKWRKESLEHYLNIGWSFAIWDSPNKLNLLGYVLCQPLLFFRGMTQTLWVEHLSAANDEVSEKLGEIIYRWSRDKHLQQIVLPKEYQPVVKSYSSVAMDGELISVNTSKLRN